jgi:hypothetical protein
MNRAAFSTKSSQLVKLFTPSISAQLQAKTQSNGKTAAAKPAMMKLVRYNQF